MFTHVNLLSLVLLPVLFYMVSAVFFMLLHYLNIIKTDT